MNDVLRRHRFQRDMILKHGQRFMADSAILGVEVGAIRCGQGKGCGPEEQQGSEDLHDVSPQCLVTRIDGYVQMRAGFVTRRPASRRGTAGRAPQTSRKNALSLACCSIYRTGRDPRARIEDYAPS